MKKKETNQDNVNVVLDLRIDEDCNNFRFASSIEAALDSAKKEKEKLEKNYIENLESIRQLTPECDKLDYVLAAGSGALCGIIDIFLVGAPSDSSLLQVSDKWFEEKTKLFAKACGWKGDDSFKSALKFLEKKFSVPYDQTGMGEAGLQYFGLNAYNHHFKSLAHNPSLLGLFFSILDQFGDKQGNVSHFISDGELVIWSVPNENRIELRGKTVPSKLFSAFINWFGHLISDRSGSYSSKGRGMGIPSQFWTWTNDVIAIKRLLKLDASEFDKSVNELALNIYTDGYDRRFQQTQAIPVFINEVLTRTIYSIRRMIKLYSQEKACDISLDLLWNHCEPFKNATVKRMLTVAHGTFCLMDVSDAAINGAVKGAGGYNVREFVLRLNLVGIGRFSISLYGEGKRGIERSKLVKDAEYIRKEKMLLDDYIGGLNILSDIYDDRSLISFVDDFKDSELYKQAFYKSVLLAEKRGVRNGMKDKNDIDDFFNGARE